MAYQKAEPVGDVYSPDGVEYSSLKRLQQTSSALQREGIDLNTALYLLELLQIYVRGRRERFRTFKNQAKEKIGKQISRNKTVQTMKAGMNPTPYTNFQWENPIGSITSCWSLTRWFLPFCRELQHIQVSARSLAALSSSLRTFFSFHRSLQSNSYKTPIR